ncbi:LCP family protein [Candidatus Desulforudis audaxviator]|uniref:LCP family protein n=1 Tax=Candidatus Desulforudis audaxviator TaxID=471827 RepID=UPI00140F7486|nr:LCP family protein [Candidatus Desulforudis audaxviator]
MSRNLRIMVSVVLVLALSIGAGYGGVRYLVMPYLFPDGGGNPEEGDNLVPGRMNVLLLGIDAQKGETIARADSILFVSADPKKQQVAILSIPRDTRVQIPGHGWDKINSATVYGGPELARKVVSGLLGVPVDYYVMTNFEGFRDIVDVLGGVTIDVERRMYYRDPMASPPLLIDLQAGVQRLDGDKALQYVRYRSDGQGDITRTQRQQKFLKALAEEMMKPRNIVKLPKLVPKIDECVDTNLSVREMLRWAALARKLDGVKIVSATLPGGFLNYRGISYWSVDPARAREVAARLLNGEEITDWLDESQVPAVAYKPSKPASSTVNSASAPAPPARTEPQPAAPDGGSPAVTPDGQGGGDSSNVPLPPPPEDPMEPPAWPVAPPSPSGNDSTVSDLDRLVPPPPPG